MVIFSLLAGAGASIGLWRVYRRGNRLLPGPWLDAGWIALLAGLLGARLAYVGVHFTYYASHALEAGALWKGGFTWWGLVAGILAGMGIASLVYRKPFKQTADVLFDLVPPLAGLVWLGCWFEGCGYGRVLAEGAYLRVPACDESGAIAMRFPLQLAAAASLTIAFILLERWIRNLPPDGLRASLGAVLLGLHTLLFSLWVQDPQPVWHGQAAMFWQALALLVIGLLSCAILWKQVRSLLQQPPISSEEGIHEIIGD